MGRHPIGDGLAVDGETLKYLSRDEEFLGLDLGSALFFDLETTGLAGGTGNDPLSRRPGLLPRRQIVVAQYFLGDPGEEDRMLEELSAFFRDGKFRSIVTYNGKAFDVPLLETRFILKRQKYVLNEWPHLDFLFSARSLWKHKYDSCRLFHLAREVVAADRSEDIPGAEIPQRLFRLLRTGDFGLIEPILTTIKRTSSRCSAWSWPGPSSSRAKAPRPRMRKVRRPWTSLASDAFSRPRESWTVRWPSSNAP